MSFNLNIAATLLIQKLEAGSYRVTIDEMRLISRETEKAKGAMGGFDRSSQSSWYSVRRLTYDLRAMSIGLMILRREFGGLNPVLDAGIQSMYVTSAAASVLIGAFSLGRDIFRVFGNDISTIKNLLDPLGGKFKELGLSAKVGWAAISALLAIGAGVWAFELASGISSVRTEIARLEKDVKSLEIAMRHLGVTQAGLTAQTANYAFWEAKIKRDAELRGYMTKAEADSLKILGESTKDVELASLRARATQAGYNAELLRTKDVAATATEAIDEYYASVLPKMGAALGGAMPPAEVGTLPPPGLQAGGVIRESGLVYAHRGEVYMPPEQVAGMVGGGFGPIVVSVSLAGARITGVEDLAAAFTRAGDEAGQSISRRLELVRRRTRSRY